jgi:2-phosphosulfolactate phosphatase
MKADLYLTSVGLNKATLEKKTVVVIDVLRASTSVCAALHSGAKGVIPASGPGEAGDMWTKIGSDMAVLAGERGGVKIENFQLGNSPLEFTAEAVGGKFVVLTTTNGTDLFKRAGGAALVICCSLCNISRVVEQVAAEEQDLIIACSGQEGSFSIEDTLCGGMLIDLLKSRHKCKLETNDASSLASLLYKANRTAIKESIRQGEHGRMLASLGFSDDVDFAANIDSLPVLPILKDGRLVLEDN